MKEFVCWISHTVLKKNICGGFYRVGYVEGYTNTLPDLIPFIKC